MPFSFSDLVIESVLREGLTAVRRDPSLVDDIFERLKTLFPIKYGQAEVNRIKTFVTEKEIYVVHSFTQVVDNLPCITIQLMDDTEDKGLARLEDHDDDVQEALDENELKAFVKVDPVISLVYTPTTGILTIDDSIDLSSVNPGYIFTDALDVEHQIVGGINNLPGQKKITLKKKQTVSTALTGTIKSPIDFKQFELKGVTHTERIMMSIHTQDRLLTLYIYTLVKYILLSRKTDLISRNFKLATLSGSDFTRNFDYGEPVFSRYLTITGIAESNWRADKVQPIDNIDLRVLVDKDIATTEDLDLENATVQVSDDD